MNYLVIQLPKCPFKSILIEAVKTIYFEFIFLGRQKPIEIDYQSGSECLPCKHAEGY